jgi:hypothetical protein
MALSLQMDVEDLVFRVNLLQQRIMMTLLEIHQYIIDQISKKALVQYQS